MKWIGGFFVLFAALAWISWPSQGPSEDDEFCSHPIMAYQTAISDLREALDVGRSADFPAYEHDGVSVDYQGDCEHRVRGVFGFAKPDQFAYEATIEYKGDYAYDVSDVVRLRRQAAE